MTSRFRCTHCTYVCTERSLAAQQAAMWCLFVLPLFYVFCMLEKFEIIRTSKQRPVQSSPKVCRAAVCLTVSHLRDVLGFCFEEHAILRVSQISLTPGLDMSNKVACS